MAGRTWEPPIKVPRLLSAHSQRWTPSTAAALRADEQVAIPHEVRRVDSTSLAVAFDALRELRFESGPGVFPRDLDQLWPNSDDVVLRDHPHELSFLDNGKPSDLSLRHQ